MTVTGSGGGALSVTGSISANGGINAGSTGITCGGINPFGGHVGQTKDVYWEEGGFKVVNTGVTPSGGDPLFSHLIYIGGVFVSWG